MEAVLKVRVPGIFMPWKEVMRGGLVMVMFGILCLCVQNYAEKSGVVQEVPVCGAAGYRVAAALEEAGLPYICRDGKHAATDMRGKLTDFPGDLSAAVKPVPVRDIPAKNPSAADIEGAWTMTRGTDTMAVVPGTNLSEVANPEIVVRDHPPVVDVTDIPGDNVIPGESVTPGENVIPGESVTPGENVIPGDTDVSEKSDVPEEIAGFILDGEGYIIGYSERVMICDGLLLIPRGESCIGIRGGAFDGLGEEIGEVYIPATISDIEPGAFDGFPYLMFVEVSGENPYYYSEDGILYSVSGEEVFCPAGRQIE